MRASLQFFVLTLGELVAHTNARALFYHDDSYFTTDSELPMDVACTGKKYEMLSAAMPVVIDLARLAINNNNETLHQLYWGACTKAQVDLVYQQMVDWYPLMSNFRCQESGRAAGGCVAYPPVIAVTWHRNPSRKGSASGSTVFCPNAFDEPGAGRWPFPKPSNGYIHTILHEVAHHMAAESNAYVLDGAPGADTCYGLDCVLRTARSSSQCTNIWIADAYAFFARALNATSSTPVPCDLPGLADWQGVPAGYQTGLPQPPANVAGTGTGTSAGTTPNPTGNQTAPDTSQDTTFGTPVGAGSSAAAGGGASGNGRPESGNDNDSGATNRVPAPPFDNDTLGGSNGSGSESGARSRNGGNNGNMNVGSPADSITTVVTATRTAISAPTVAAGGQRPPSGAGRSTSPSSWSSGRWLPGRWTRKPT